MYTQFYRNVSDTLPQSINSVLNWTYVLDILQAELVDYSDDSDDNKRDDLTTKYKIVVQSEMHKVVARPWFLPY
jgi:hypothetical protein